MIVRIPRPRPNPELFPLHRSLASPPCWHLIVIYEMKAASSFLLSGFVHGSLWAAVTASAQTLTQVDFAEFTLAPESYYQTAVTDTPTHFTSKGVSFSHVTPSWGGFSDFTVSNTSDTSTGTYLNPSSAIPGGGRGDANYGVGYVSTDFTGDYSTIPLAMTFGHPGGVAPVSISLTNTTYTALSMLHGDSYAKQFGGATGLDEDYFRLTITGYDTFLQATGSVEFYLADYRFADSNLDYIIDEWTTMDLSSLGSGVTSLTFDLASSDAGVFGINTPTYFAFDDLTFAAVPEPRTYAALLGLLGLAIAFRRRNR